MPLINCKVKFNMEKKCVLSTHAGANNTDAVLISMIQNYTFQLLLCQKKIIKILLIKKIKVFNNLFIRTNMKEKNKMKMELLMLLSI